MKSFFVSDDFFRTKQVKEVFKNEHKCKIKNTTFYVFFNDFTHTTFTDRIRTQNFYP